MTRTGGEGLGPLADGRGRTLSSMVVGRLESDL